MTGGLESLLFPRPQNRTDSIACCLADSFTCVGIVGVAIMAVGITGVGKAGASRPYPILIDSSVLRFFVMYPAMGVALYRRGAMDNLAR